MTSLDEQLDQFAGEPEELAPEPPKPKRRKRVSAFSKDQPIPGEERSSVNLRHWNALKQTDPKYTKPFKRAGGFSGTAITPVWTEMRMTQHFGPCGIGWGMDQPQFQLQEITGNGELLVFCTVRLWYRDGGGDRDGEVWGVGGDKVIARAREGLRTNDEAFKACYTDALSNAMKHLGVAADVHMGLFDDNKYVREMAEAFKEPAPPTGNGHAAALDAGPDDVPPLTADEIKEIIRFAVEAAGHGRDAFRRMYVSLPGEAKLALKPHMDKFKAICEEADKLPAKPPRKSATV